MTLRVHTLFLGTMNLLAPEFQDEDAARAYLERLRWPDGPVCPHCGSMKTYKITPNVHSRTSLPPQRMKMGYFKSKRRFQNAERAAQMRRLSEAIHGHSWNDLPPIQGALEQMALGYLPYCILEEGL